MSDIFIVNGQISSKVAELTMSILNELTNPTKYKVSDLIAIGETDPVVYACAQLKSARISQLIGKYTNKDKQKQDFIHYNLNNVEDTIEGTAGRLGSACGLGFSCAEINFRSEKFRFDNMYTLKGFNHLNPAKTYFRIKNGDPIDVKYENGDRWVYIPYWKVIHVVNSFNTAFGRKYLYGSPEFNRVYPYVKLKQLVFGELAVAAKTRASGLLVGQADSATKVIDPTDLSGTKSISALQALGMQLAEVENGNIIVTDKQNSINSLQIPAGEQFWNLAKQLVDEQITRALMIPQMVWSEGSGALGVGSLSNTQLSILDSSLLSVVQMMRDQFIERIVKPLIIYNFGKQSDYGKFEFQPDNDPQMEAMVTSNLLQALTMGVIPSTDYEAKNALRERLKLNPTTFNEEGFQNMLRQQLMALQQQAAPQVPEGENVGEESQQQGQPNTTPELQAAQGGNVNQQNMIEPY